MRFFTGILSPHMRAEAEKFLTQADFGRGTMIGDDPAIFDLTPGERVIVSAWRHACPQPDMVVKYYGDAWKNTQPDPMSIPEVIVIEHGIRITRERYDECDFVYKQWICDMTEKHNKPLYKQLTSITKRLSGEPMGIHETGRIPQTHEQEMSPLSTLVGFSLPRVFIEIAGRGSNRTAGKYFNALDILETHIRDSQTPVELLARMTESAIANGVEPNTVLSHVLEPGILREENNHTEYMQVGQALSVYAPSAWRYYVSITPTEREAAGMINLPAIA